MAPLVQCVACSRWFVNDLGLSRHLAAKPNHSLLDRFEGVSESG